MRWMLYVAPMLGFGLAQQNATIYNLKPNDWKALNASVNGRLHDDGAPFARACFQLYNGTSSPVDQAACAKIQVGYTDHFMRLSSIGSYTNPQWETCQATSEDCLLDWTNPTNSLASSPPRQCFQGSVSRYFIDVRKPSDVIEAFKFSKRTGVPLVVKNTGHDYSGRSSAPNSLALWTRNIQHISYNAEFVAQGCEAPSAQPGVTFGAGNYFDQLFQFAEQNNLTIVGGSDRTVGAAGGWVQGGGHSVLSNTLGLGVDRVLEFKVVTPTGEYLTVNACQNQELFFALRGGGGGTFGVVFETTFRAEPKAIPLQVMKITFPQNLNDSAEFLKIAIDNADRWANEGWGGYVNAYTSLLVTPKLTTDQAIASVKPVLDFIARVNGTAQVVQSPSFYNFYNSFILVNENPIGLPGAPTSRLVPRTNFATNQSRAELHDAIMTGRASSQFFQVIINTPISYKHEPGKTAVTDAWRTSLWHVVFGNFWNFGTSLEVRKQRYADASKAVQPLRDITPGSGAYQNEADIYEPNHEVAFWGSNYNRLLATKQKYDPTGILGCWHCVASRPSDPRLSCYL